MRASRTSQILFTSMLGVLLIQQGARANEERFGEVNFPISCSSAAQAQFNRGIAMLHSFFYPETINAFSALAQQEPTCAMAYWGIAISQRPNPLVGPFPGDVLKAGWEAIDKARAVPQKKDRERNWIETLAAFFENYGSVPAVGIIGAGVIAAEQLKDVRSACWQPSICSSQCRPAAEPRVTTLG